MTHRPTKDTTSRRPGSPSLAYLTEEITNLYNSGSNIKDIARKLDIGLPTVSKYLPKDIPRHKRKRGAQDVKRERKIIALYRSHKTLKEIGGIYGISLQRAAQIIARFEQMSSVSERNATSGQKFTP
jgi:DNA-binding CsgD family transcriptional regulator